ncbi:hypothetical protein [Mucilaginibacter auburnensis]|uniref:Secreted protein with PEP-CTERM sorting signal n=1 Tax=Mucilaginibacter auburnensis TaxID=1457233 RepID=A0A2H9VTX7_9SPHI|nr:hypothetical protein [Mucilaginibacter auburnensis]PJJ84276.1 hypothetical protein CLV57_1287 [Mucilaginibacter auburnensis]
MQKIRKILVLLVSLLLTSGATFADCEVPASGDPDDPTGYDPNCLPLDNWLIVLFIAGLAFATWYLHNKQKKEAIA